MFSLLQLHDYKAGTPSEKTHFIEMWDVGGWSAHQNSRSIFYQGVNGKFQFIRILKNLDGSWTRPSKRCLKTSLTVCMTSFVVQLFNMKNGIPFWVPIFLFNLITATFSLQVFYLSMISQIENLSRIWENGWQKFWTGTAKKQRMSK